MTSLRALQADFTQHILLNDEKISCHIVGTDDKGVADRLSIYRNAYFSRLKEVLEKDFPGLKGLMKAGNFEQFCHLYIEANPSHHPSLRWFGRNVEPFLKNAENFSHSDPLMEMARFEWALLNCFDACDRVSSRESAVGEIDAENWHGIILVFHPAVRIMSLVWNTMAQWRDVKQGRAVREMNGVAGIEYCLIWREALEPRFRQVSEEEYMAIDYMQQAHNFGQLCESLVTRGVSPEVVPLTAAGYLKTWLNHGLITAVRL